MHAADILAGMHGVPVARQAVIIRPSRCASPTCASTPTMPC